MVDGSKNEIIVFLSQSPSHVIKIRLLVFNESFFCLAEYYILCVYRNFHRLPIRIS